MKKIIKAFSIILFSALLMILFNSNTTSAIYDSSKNTIGISVSKESVKVTVKYQRGFDVGTATYFWCPVASNTVDELQNPSDCKPLTLSEEEMLKPLENNYVTNSEYSNLDFISESPANNADSNITSYTFTISKDKDPVLNQINNLIDRGYREFVVFAQANFCAKRYVNGDGTVGGCQFYDSIKSAKISTNIVNIENDHFGFDAETDDSGINDMMDKISGIVKETVLPIIWVVLGLFLVVKGAMLGVQIVKSADEPQVRQEKVGALKWLIIGVAIAYASTGVVTVVMNFFDGTFGGK